MVLTNNNWYRRLSVPVLFILIFSSLAWYYVNRADNSDQELFRQHAAILADDIWALDQSGAEGYLQLVVKTNHYRSLQIDIPGTSGFVRVTSEPLTGLSYYLFQLKLIGKKELSRNISYNKQVIGILHGEKYIRVIFPLMNLLVFLLLVALTIIFIIHLSVNRKILEQQVDERTRKLQDSERRFHNLVNLLPEMIIETDREANITYANKVAREQLHLPADPLAITNIFPLVIEEERQRAREHFSQCLRGERSELIEYTVVTPNSRRFPTLVRTVPTRSGAVISGVRMIVIDITERRALKEQLERDQKMKAIGLMAGGVAHDLNNILSGIISYPEFLLLDLEEDSSMRQPLEAIRQSGLDASEVVSDLLTVARGIAANKEVIAPNELIRSYLDSTDFKQLQGDYPEVTFSTSLDPELRNISCSPIHVRKCLMNLIRNGVEAIEGRGTVSISTASHRDPIPPEKGGKSTEPGNFSRITIRDDGSGISPDDLNHIFEPFYTRKVMGRSGTGLGLAVVWNTMLDHGGTVNVGSDISGTVFELKFPSVDYQTSPEREEIDWKRYRGRGESILVVDDEKRQRDIAESLLSSLNYLVTTVSSGEQAVEYVKSHPVDLVFLDMIMAPGINGRVTYEKILIIQPQQKAVIVSGFAEDEDVQATLEMGAGAFLSKPYTLERLASAIYKVIRL